MSTSKAILNLTEKDLGVHIRAALGTPSGQVLKEFLRVHCYMAPARKPRDWNEHEQVEFRYGRMTLFQMLEFYLDPENTGVRVAKPEPEDEEL